jgi:hypothetical protein
MWYTVTPPTFFTYNLSFEVLPAVHLGGDGTSLVQKNRAGPSIENELVAKSAWEVYENDNNFQKRFAKILFRQKQSEQRKLKFSRKTNFVKIYENSQNFVFLRK